MRYYIKNSSLIIRGKFRVCSSGTNGGVRLCTTLINHQVEENFFKDPSKEIELKALSLGVSPQLTAGLLTAVPMHTLCILIYEGLTTFITAGITHPDQENQGLTEDPMLPGTINIILISKTHFSDQGLIDALITATEAKSMALIREGYSCMGTLTDAIITATEMTGDVRYAGSATKVGRMIHESVYFGVQEAMKRWKDCTIRQNPSLFIKSSIGGDHWIEWQKTGCPYYPCHFQGQRCDFCYCPLYPCEDISLGDWLEKDERFHIWSCARCTLIHEPAVVSHLLRNPEASINELKVIYQNKSVN